MCWRTRPSRQDLQPCSHPPWELSPWTLPTPALLPGERSSPAHLDSYKAWLASLAAKQIGCVSGSGAVSANPDEATDLSQEGLSSRPECRQSADHSKMPMLLLDQFLS